MGMIPNKLNSKWFWFVSLGLLALAFLCFPHPAALLAVGFGLVNTARSINEAVSETVLVRDVPDEVMVLDGDITPLIVMTTNAKRKRPTFSPRVEKLEDDLRTLWGYMNAAAIDSVTTSVLVDDGTKFAAGDLATVLRVSTDTGVEEVIRVTAVNTNTLTVVRGIGGFKDTISASNALRIIGSAYAENASYGTPRSTSKTTVESYTQIFREPFQVSETIRASKTYGGPEEDYQERTALLNWKKQV